MVQIWMKLDTMKQLKVQVWMQLDTTELASAKQIDVLKGISSREA